MTGRRTPRVACRRPAAAIAALVLMLPLVACSEDEDTLTVLAAASLTGSFTELAAAFEAEHPGVDVRLAFDSSATMARQALDGAPADVLATADERTMADAAEALAADPQVFATNEMVLVTPAGNPAGVRGLADLDRPGVAWVACVETAPCGAVAAALTRDLRGRPASLEVDVKAVLAKVAADEADAGLVYATDAKAAAGRVEALGLDGSSRERTAYPVAPLRQSGDAALAQEFVDLVVSDTGRRILDAAGFGPP